MNTYCSKCDVNWAYLLTETDDEGEEEYEMCPKCKSDAFLEPKKEGEVFSMRNGEVIHTPGCQVTNWKGEESICMAIPCQIEITDEEGNIEPLDADKFVSEYGSDCKYNLIGVPNLFAAFDENKKPKVPFILDHASQVREFYSKTKSSR